MEDARYHDRILSTFLHRYPCCIGIVPSHSKASTITSRQRLFSTIPAISQIACATFTLFYRQITILGCTPRPILSFGDSCSSSSIELVLLDGACRLRPEVSAMVTVTQVIVF